MLRRLYTINFIDAFIVGAILSPPDVASQCLLSVPLCLLYGVSIGIAYVFRKKRAPKPAETAEPP